MSQDINTKEIYDCEGCRDLNSKLEVAMEEIRLRDKAEKALQQQLKEAQGKRGKVVSVEEMRAFAAQGFCTKRNSYKLVDVALIEDVVTAIHKAVYGSERRVKNEH
jgi:hypothetical protein